MEIPINPDTSVNSLAEGVGGVFRDQFPANATTQAYTGGTTNVEVTDKHRGRNIAVAVVALLVTGGGAGLGVAAYFNSTNNHNADGASDPAAVVPIHSAKATIKPKLIPTPSAIPTASIEPTATVTETVSENPVEITQPASTVTVIKTAEPEPIPTFTTTVTASPIPTPEQTPSTPAQGDATPTVIIDVPTTSTLGQNGKNWWKQNWGHGNERDGSDTIGLDAFRQELATRLKANGVNIIINSDTTVAEQGDLLVSLGSGRNEVLYDTLQASPFNPISKKNAVNGCVAEKVALATWQNWQGASNDVAGPTDNQHWWEMGSEIPSMTITVGFGNGSEDMQKEQQTTLATVISAALTDASAGLQTDNVECAQSYQG